MLRSKDVYGIDTSVFVRLLTGHPEKEFLATTEALVRLHTQRSTAEIVVSNQVIGEAYITLQHHYGISKQEARDAMLRLFASGSVRPLNGDAVVQVLEAAAGGAGLMDRLIAQDYVDRGCTALTNDKRMAKVPGCELLT